MPSLDGGYLFVIKSSNSALVKAAPLSDTNISEMPIVEKIELNLVIVVIDVQDWFVVTASIHFE